MAKRSIAGLRGILTGASSGIGAALAEGLVRRGAQLVCVARRGDELSRLAERVHGAPGALEPVVGDITDADMRRQAIHRAQTAFGGLDLLINNAGIGALGRFEQSTPERLRRIMEVNFFAAAELVRESLPLLTVGRSPIIVNMGSILGHRGIPRSSEYCASKFALRGWSESLRAELAPRGIDLLLVSPGTTHTEFFAHALTQEPVPWGNQPGVSPQFVARRMIAAIERGRHEIIINHWGRLLVWLNRISPRLVDRLMERYA